MVWRLGSARYPQQHCSLSTFSCLSQFRRPPDQHGALHSVIANYTVPCWDLPRYLYFVEYAQKQACCNSDGNFKAADIWSPLRGPNHLHQLVPKHVNWANLTQFISTFADYHHTFNWARQRQPWVTIYEIDTERLDDRYCWVFHASEFTPRCFESEFLFLHTISGDAIVRTTTLGRSACK